MKITIEIHKHHSAILLQAFPSSPVMRLPVVMDDDMQPNEVKAQQRVAAEGALHILAMYLARAAGTVDVVDSDKRVFTYDGIGGMTIQHPDRHDPVQVTA